MKNHFIISNAKKKTNPKAHETIQHPLLTVLDRILSLTKASVKPQLTLGPRGEGEALACGEKPGPDVCSSFCSSTLYWKSQCNKARKRNETVTHRRDCV